MVFLMEMRCSICVVLVLANYPFLLPGRDDVLDV